MVKDIFFPVLLKENFEICVYVIVIQADRSTALYISYVNLLFIHLRTSLISASVCATLWWDSPSVDS